jgi:thiosulfate reductase cytochrome b subunit
MKAATERKIIRWFHILASIPIIGFVYGPVSTIPEAVTMVRWVIFPLVILSGFWMWKGYVVKRWFR